MQRDQLLHVPAGLAEFHGQPVEQFRVRRRRGLRAEVVGRLEESGAEELLPEPIDGDAREQRVRRDRLSSARARGGFAADPAPSAAGTTGVLASSSSRG